MVQGRVITDYSDYKAVESIKLAKMVKAGCAKSEKTKLDEALDRELGVLTAELEQALAAASDGGRSKIVERNSANSKMKALLKTVARRVNFYAEGDTTALSLSGFPLVKVPIKMGDAPIPTGLKVRSGANHGEAVVEMKAYSGALVYNVLFKDASLGDDGTGWTMVQSTRRKLLIGNLISGKTYLIKACYKSTSTRLVFSSSIFFVAQ